MHFLLFFVLGYLGFCWSRTKDLAFHEEVEGFYVQSLGTKSHGLIHSVGFELWEVNFV